MIQKRDRRRIAPALKDAVQAYVRGGEHPDARVTARFFISELNDADLASLALEVLCDLEATPVLDEMTRWVEERIGEKVYVWIDPRAVIEHLHCAQESCPACGAVADVRNACMACPGDDIPAGLQSRPELVCPRCGYTGEVVV